MKALFCPVWYTMGKVVYREEYCFRHGLVGDSTRTSETIFWATQREPFFFVVLIERSTFGGKCLA